MGLNSYSHQHRLADGQVIPDADNNPRNEIDPDGRDPKQDPDALDDGRGV